MKRSIFAVFAVLTLLLAVPAVAQQEETRTNPDADSIAGNSGLTITGTVVEWNDKQLTLRTTTGVEHVQIVQDTDKPVELTAGETVTVDYTRTTQGVMIAQEIRTEGATASTDTEVVTSELQTDTDAMDADVQAEADVEAGIETDATTSDEFDTDATVDTRADFEADVDTDLDTQADLDTEADLDTTLDDQDTLPATGSELPLVALLGLLTVAAALGVRSYIR